jgi:hypothetical protein
MYGRVGQALPYFKRLLGLLYDHELRNSPGAVPQIFLKRATRGQ